MRHTLADLFTGSLVLYLVLFLLENVFPGLVSTVFSLNYLLIPVLLFGILSSLFPQPKIKVTPKFKPSDIWLSVFLSLVGGGLIYYKIDLDFPIRPIITVLSALLILLMSLLVVLPENFRLPKINFRRRYLLPLLLIPLFFLLPKPQPGPVVVRLPSDQYHIILINRSANKNYSDSYKKLLFNNGYTQVDTTTSDSYPATTSVATIMYGSTDIAAGQEVADLLQQSFGTIQTSPLLDTEPQTIVIILQ